MNRTSAMTRSSIEEKADQLLMEWHAWTSGWRPDLGVPGCAPECRGAKSSRQWDSTSEIVDESCHKVEMEAVQFCFESIPFSFQNAIAIEMKNREVKLKVWRSMMGKTYEEALAVIVPIMRRKCLFD